MNKDHYIFIDRMITIIDEHFPVDQKLEVEISPHRSLWQVTTPQEYLCEVVKAYGPHSEANIRASLHRALDDGMLDRALFLIIVLSRFGEYLEAEKRKRPWDFEEHY